MYLASSPIRLSGSIALLMACVCLTPAVQAMSIRELRAVAQSDKKQGEHYVRYYLVGAMEGTLEAHAHGVRNGAKPTICPGSRRLEPRMAPSLYDTELKRNAEVYEADMPVTLVMINALSTVYPCL